MATGYALTNSDGKVIDADGKVISSTVFKSYAIADVGTADTHFIGGFYAAPAAESVLNQGALTQTYGTAGRMYGAHAFLVAKEAGTATGGSGAVTIVVSGVSITDAGARNDADSETIVADITALSVNDYIETTKKWLGQVTYTITVGATGHTAYAASFNYGFCKYEDFGNRDFTLTDFEILIHGGASETALNAMITHHKITGWTYSAAGFIPGTGAVVSSVTDYSSTNDNYASNDDVAYKRAGLTTAVSGSTVEGIIVIISNAVNNSIKYGTIHVGVELT